MQHREQDQRAAWLLRNRDFLLLWTGQAVSQVGDRVQQIALVWWALEHGGTAAGVSTALVAVSLPVVLVSLYAGVWFELSLGNWAT